MSDVRDPDRDQALPIPNDRPYIQDLKETTVKRYAVTYRTQVEITVHIDAVSEDEAEADAWNEANEHANTIIGNGRNITTAVSLDGIGADEITPITQDAGR